VKIVLSTVRIQNPEFARRQAPAALKALLESPEARSFNVKLGGCIPETRRGFLDLGQDRTIFSLLQEKAFAAAESGLPAAGGSSSRCGEEMDSILQAIARFPAFNGLSEDELAALRKIAVQRNFARGERVFSEGDPGNGFYLVFEGQVKVYKLSPEGKEQILHIIRPGEPFGEVAVFAGRSFPANAEAIAASRLLFLPRDAFVALIGRNPSLAMNMLAVLSRRLRQFTVQVENLSLKEVPGRLASYLLVLSQEQSRSDKVQLPISKGQLASLLGTIPETLSRIFARMAEQGLIDVQGRTIALMDPESLEAVAEQGKVV